MVFFGGGGGFGGPGIGDVSMKKNGAWRCGFEGLKKSEEEGKVGSEE